MVLLAALDMYVQFRVKLFNDTSDYDDVSSLIVLKILR